MGITHLGEHTGYTQVIRAQSAKPTDPDPEHVDGVGNSAVTGDIYYDTDVNVLYINNASVWVGVNFS